LQYRWPTISSKSMKISQKRGSKIFFRPPVGSKMAVVYPPGGVTLKRRLLEIVCGCWLGSQNPRFTNQQEAPPGSAPRVSLSSPDPRRWAAESPRDRLGRDHGSGHPAAGPPPGSGKGKPWAHIANHGVGITPCEIFAGNFYGDRKKHHLRILELISPALGTQPSLGREVHQPPPPSR